jgi:hypothetical protein
MMTNTSQAKIPEATDIFKVCKAYEHCEDEVQEPLIMPRTYQGFGRGRE